MSQTHKVIVTNRARLRAKYRTAGLKRVERAVQSLIRADGRRGIVSTLVYLDDRVQMEKIGARRVSNVNSRKQNKVAIDGVYAALKPDYVMILGAPDVIPHQILDNPTGDEDSNVPSDLPYACDQPYGREARDFLGPTRVVGRLPNVNGDDDPRYLISLLDRARRWRSRAASTYGRGFVLTADVWKGSTRTSAGKLFGTQKGVLLSPPEGPPHRRNRLARRVHFINCHGAEEDPRFYGEDDAGDYPTSHRARSLNGLNEGTVAAAECCYGAQLYEAERGFHQSPGICNAYLKKGVYGFFGSSTVAYGPPDGNGSADLICLYFVRNVQKGASIGRAALEARQRFIREEDIGPFNLKTLAQFHLLGDPSIHPARATAPKTRVEAKSRGSAKGVGKGTSFGSARRSRRGRLRSTGKRLLTRTTAVLSKPDRIDKRIADKAVQKLVAERAWDAVGVRRYSERAPSAAPLAAKSGVGAKAKAQPKGLYHVIPERARPRKTESRIHTRRFLVAKQENGRITGTWELVPR